MPHRPSAFWSGRVGPSRLARPRHHRGGGRRRAAPRLRPGQAGQRLQLGHLYRRDHARRFHRGHRHRGPLRPVCQQRGAVRKAPRGQLRLRRDLPLQQLRRADDRGRDDRAARPCETAEHRQRGRALPEPELRSRPRAQRALLLGHPGHRLPEVGGRSGAHQVGRHAGLGSLQGSDRAVERHRHRPCRAQVPGLLTRHQGSRGRSTRPPLR